MRHTTLSGPKSPASPVIAPCSTLRSELFYGDRAHDVAALRLERDVHAGRGHEAEEVVALGEIARAVGGGDEELRAVGVGTRVGHRQRTERVLAEHGLVVPAVARATASGAFGIAALDHEPGLHAVEGETVVAAGLRELHEGVDRVRRELRVEVGDDLAEVGGDARAVGLVGVDLERRGLRHGTPTSRLTAFLRT